MRNFIICLCLLTLTVTVYWQVRRFQFSNYDDDAYIYQNRHILNGLTWADCAMGILQYRASQLFPADLDFFRLGCFSVWAAAWTYSS